MEKCIDTRWTMDALLRLYSDVRNWVSLNEYIRKQQSEKWSLFKTSNIFGTLFFENFESKKVKRETMPSCFYLGSAEFINKKIVFLWYILDGQSKTDCTPITIITASLSCHSVIIVLPLCCLLVLSAHLWASDWWAARAHSAPLRGRSQMFSQFAGQ